MLQLLYYNQLDSKQVQKNFDKVLQQLCKGDFKSADVRKMAGTGYYRARLNGKDRLLFSFVSCNQQKYLLLLEVICNHDYARSRFLRGAQLPSEEDMAPVLNIREISNDEIKTLPYVNESDHSIHILNKFISFDETQKAIFHLFPPLIIIGSAGSGKTVLMLEKLKQLKGNVAYVSLSEYLVENARKMYYANGYDNEDNETDFLSFKQYIESWKVPRGKEIHFRMFEQWFNRHAQHAKLHEPYRVYEEFKGVLTGSPVHAAWLSKEEYLALGIKQSIFLAHQREQVYDLFIRYLQWMKENTYYDSNILSYDYLQLVKPRYDYIMVDEVQDITNIQLKCIMQSLIHPGHFILTGDSNQIVHPNFFSWSKIKTYLYHENTHNELKQIRMLQTNYRNSPQVVTLSNTLLKIKNARFGAIDRESNYLINTISQQQGEVALMADDEKAKAELNRKTQHSIRYAVIVTDNAMKEAARRHFKTPLIFSIHEAKGLEYENVILLDFVSAHASEFNEIINGIDKADLQQEELQYGRAADKSGKEAEVYKFYINALYVAITRAVKNIYLFEKQYNHPALELLALKESKKPLQVAEQQSDKQEWLEEARRLAEQGKHEQAEQIRAKYLGYEYISPQQLEQIKALALDPAKKEAEVKKERKQLFQYAQSNHKTEWIDQLARLQFQRAVLYMKELKIDGKEYAKNCRLGRLEDVTRIVKKYGPDFAPPDTGMPGLSVTLYHGQDNVAEYLLRQQANTSQRSTDNLLPVEYLLQGFYKSVIYRQNFTAGGAALLKFWFPVRPSSLVAQVNEQRLMIGSQSMPFFLLVCMRSIEREVAEKINVQFEANSRPSYKAGVFSMDEIMKYIACMPEDILPEYRRQRQYVNAVLSQHEAERDSPFCKRLFKRVKRGSYIINPHVIVHQ